MSYVTTGIPTVQGAQYGGPARQGGRRLGGWFDAEVEEGGDDPTQIDDTAPPVFCPDGSTGISSGGVTYCAGTAQPTTPAPPVSAPPKTPTTPPKTTAPATPMPTIVVAPPKPAGLSTMTMVGLGAGALVLVGGIVYLKKGKAKSGRSGGKRSRR